MIAWRSFGKDVWLLVNDSPESRHEGWANYPEQEDKTWKLLARLERINGRWCGTTYPNREPHLGSSESSGTIMKRAEANLRDRKLLFHGRLDSRRTTAVLPPNRTDVEKEPPVEIKVCSLPQGILDGRIY